ncbi:ABC transporter permease [Vallitalea maricola]|uniref:ABC transporter permease n=1 Tax=Vallitalea maricola TaxID=3074433 RepID=A0ACB5UFL7_9FIRM|nr:ABC transporter permease [Vallitalea sp. AN17-2]
MNFFNDIFTTTQRYLKSQVQTPYFLVFSIAQPIFWLIIFGQLFEGMFTTGGYSYIQFITPGIVVMNVLYDAGYSGMSVIEDIEHGVFYKILASPTNKLAIVIGNLLASFLSIFIQVTIVIIIALMLGFSFYGNLLDLLIMIVAIGLLAFGVSGCSKALAFFTRKDDPVVIIVNFITMPLIFLSSILLPAESMPNWAGKLILFNPLEYAVRIVRQCCYGAVKDANFGYYLVILLCFAIVGVILSTLGIKRTTD